MQTWRGVMVLVVAAAAAAACGDDQHDGGGGDGGPNGDTHLKAKLDLSHTIGFAIAKSGASPRLLGTPADPACMPSTLYAVQDNGDMIVTTVTETFDPALDAGMCNTSQRSENAHAVYDAAKYVVFGYQPALSLGGASGGKQCGFVVMRKSDGALFCDERMDASFREVEGANDKLYFGASYLLVRVDMTTTPPTETTINDGMMTGDYIDSLDVDAIDNALIGGGFGLRIYKATGGLMNISATRPICQWLDPDGSFYYGTGIDPTVDQPGRTIITRLAPATYSPTPVGELVSSNGGLPGCTVALAAGMQTVAIQAGSTSLREIVQNGPGQCWQNSAPPTGTCNADADCNGSCVAGQCGGGMCCQGGGNPGRQCTQPSDCAGTCMTAGAEHPVAGITMLKSAVGRAGKVYVQGTDAQGNGAVIRVDVPGFTQTTLLAPGLYTLNAISLSNNSELTFAGQRNSDGATVLGNCNASGCTVLNATAPAVSSLQRIN